MRSLAMVFGRMRPSELRFFSTTVNTATSAIRFPATRVPEPERAVFVGDLHGCGAAFKNVLQIAKLVDSSGRWAAEDTVLVQVGDVFDRGDDDLYIEEELCNLGEQAKAAGGAVHMLLGNHELLNAMGDHSMATPGAFKPFETLANRLPPALLDDAGPLAPFPKWSRARLAAMLPGGPVGKLLSGHSVAMVVGDTLVVHAGLEPFHLDEGAASSGAEGDKAAGGGAPAPAPVPSQVELNQFEDVVVENRAVNGAAALERWNRIAHEWLIGARDTPRELCIGNSPLWTRRYSSPDSVDLTQDARSDLEEVLRRTACRRLVVGHTPQRRGINSAADSQVWRIDTGMTAMMGGRPEVLEIKKGGDIAVLTEAGAVPASSRQARARQNPVQPPQ